MDTPFCILPQVFLFLKTYILDKIMWYITSAKVKPSNKKVKPSKVKTKKKKSKYPLQDESSRDLEKLLEEGYNKVTFIDTENADPCPICRRMNGRTWNLINLLRTTYHDAPLFSHSHVNCRCILKVWDSEGILPTAYVDYTGEFFREDRKTFSEELQSIIDEDYNL